MLGAADHGDWRVIGKFASNRGQWLIGEEEFVDDDQPRGFATLVQLPSDKCEVWHHP